MYRHGDLLLEHGNIPAEATIRKNGILAYGEATGHAHRVIDEAIVYENGEDVFIRVMRQARVTHEEHGTITLPAGDFKVIRQREFDPYSEAVRRVAD